VSYDRFELGDSRLVTFNLLTERDLPELVPVYNSIIEEGLYFIRNGELPDVKTAQEWYREQVKAGMVYIVVRVNNELFGGASIEPREGKASHVGYFGIYLKKEFRSLGIGTRLIRKIIEVARQKNLEIIQLYVFASNKQAIHIYKKFGFQEAGRIKKGIRLQNGKYTDEIIMTLHLKNLPVKSPANTYTRIYEK